MKLIKAASLLLTMTLILLLPLTEAANLNLSNTPLFLGKNTQPNIFFELDDSGSMDWEILSRPHWHYCAYDPDAGSYNDSSSSCGWLVENGLIRIYTASNWEYFEYIFNNTDDAYSNSCDSSRQTVEMCNSSDMDQEWRAKSAAMNVTYYNPAVTYKPWIGSGMTDADFAHVRSDPEPTSAGYSDQRDLNGFVYHVWEDSHGWNTSDASPLRGANRNRTVGANGFVDLWDNHIAYVISGNSFTKNTISYNLTDTSMGETIVSTTISGSATDIYGRTIAETKINIANWYQYHRKRSYVTKGAVASVMNNSPSFRYGLSVINNEHKLFKEVPDQALTPPFTAHNNDIVQDLFKFDWPASGTPLRRGLELTGRYFDHDLMTNPDTGSAMDDPIVDTCQQNFSVLFTDGYWNGSDPAAAIADADGDGIDLSIADVARYYYDRDLSTLANEVAANMFDSASHQHMVTFTVAFGLQGLLIDSSNNGWPNNADGTEKTAADNWGNPFCSDCPEKIDDLWHAAYNSKGTFVSASTPEDVVKSLNDAINNVADRTSSAASVALNSGTLIGDTFIFQARFDSGTWEGELLAIPVDADGSIGSVSWNAGNLLQLQDHTAREILSFNGTQGIAFDWPVNHAMPAADELTASQISALLSEKPASLSTTAQVQDYGSKLIDYLRGDDSHKGTMIIPRNNRTGKLGDIIHSDPFFVAKPVFRYPENWVDIQRLSAHAVDTSEAEDLVSYAAYQSANNNRSKMIYVGANDGMMHGFFAESTARNGHHPGDELIAYVPSSIIKNLPQLTKDPFVHRYYVDGPTTVGDVLYNSAWHTVLVGALHSGGQGIYAIDVTDPELFDETNAADLVLWEFSDANDEDMGYSFSQPAIVRMHNGKWAAVFGNGYNNTEVDASVSSGVTAGQAVLYIVDIETGILIKKIETKVGISDPASNNVPNGLSTPAPVDVDGDHIVDLIYAGDLYGNLWKFDVSDTNINQWDIAYKHGSDWLPVFTAETDTHIRQAITTRPEVTNHPTGQGYLLLFGTGKYMEIDDAGSSGQNTQTFYGIWDKDENTLDAFDRDDLLEQIIIQELLASYDTDADGSVDTSYELRHTSDYTPLWHIQSGTPTSNPQIDENGDPLATHLGWSLDLLNTQNNTNTNNYGEKQVSNSILRNGRIIFTTLLPSTSSCSFGGDSWLMELDAQTGSRLSYAPFDLNNDNVFNRFDFINAGDINGDGNDDYLPPSGKKSGNGITPAPGIIADGNTEYKYTSGSSGNIEKITENPGPSAYGRQSWIEIR
ncbi:MAG: pilus assembly protein [gamma proteobacterium symbiont of Taylorina sp.]|nr:pilus assembly protein [gamma proteobacterium symbiont of Taylorina sp.]